MEQLKIIGSKKLMGSVNITTSKNALLPILCACILVDGQTTIKNFCSYSDSLTMLDILSDIGLKVSYETENILSVNASCEISGNINSCAAQKIRSSFFALGSILARVKKAVFCYPGGCNIGARPVDLHIKAFRELGVDITERHGYIYASLTHFNGGEVYLDIPSVGVTENIMLLACTLCGTTIIKNPAKEPEIVDLQNFLVKAGAKVFGAGTDKITIIGINKLLKPIEYTPISDRIIAGTYMLAVACCGGNVKLKSANAEHNQDLITKLSSVGVNIFSDTDGLIVQCNKRLKCIPIIKTNPYPYFATDLQPQMAVLQSISFGSSLIEENIFESRLGYTSQLIKMGANIKVKNNMAFITGVKSLYGADVNAPDLRAGAGLVIAGLCASGYTTISGVNFIDRGYYKIEKDLSFLGADIIRVIV